MKNHCLAAISIDLFYFCPTQNIFLYFFIQHFRYLFVCVLSAILYLNLEKLVSQYQTTFSEIFIIITIIPTTECGRRVPTQPCISIIPSPQLGGKPDRCSFMPGMSRASCSPPISLSNHCQFPSACMPVWLTETQPLIPSGETLHHGNWSSAP